MIDSVIAASGNNGRSPKGMGGNGGMGVRSILVNTGTAIGHEAYRLLANNRFDTGHRRRKKPSVQFLFGTNG